MAKIRFRYRTPGSERDIRLALRKADPSIPEGLPGGTELAPAVVDRWWRESSFDLWRGLEVREDPPDTMPAEWLLAPSDRR